MILMIDNYDSFTYNLVQYLKESGEEVIVGKNDVLTLRGIEKLKPQGIVISPGPGNPLEAGISVDTIGHFAGKIPILGVCLGHQAIACAFGASIEVNWRMMHGKISYIYHDGKGIYDKISNPFAATRYHSLVINPCTLPSFFAVSAYSEKGEVMGIRHKYYPVEGVQFHPESIMTKEGKVIIRNFLSMMEQWWLYHK